MAKQIRVSLETESVLVFRAGAPMRQWCAQCGAERDMVPIEEAGLFSNLEKAEVEEWFNSDGLHRSKNSAGRTCICLDSLLAHVQSPQLSEPRATAAQDPKERK